MLQIVEFNDDLEFGKIRKMDTRGEKERKKERIEGKSWGLGRWIKVTMGLTDRSEPSVSQIGYRRGLTSARRQRGSVKRNNGR